MKQLYGTAFRCGEPSCSRPLYRLNNETGERILNSRVAHIHARSEGGPRWAPEMAEEENRSEDNLLLLCVEHASEVDDTPEHFPAETLREWKQAQLDEYAELQWAWPLNDAEAAEASAASFDPHQVGVATAGATTVLAAARCVGLMVATGSQQRRVPREAAQAWQALRERTTRSMPAYDADGERVQVEPSMMETKPYLEALEAALSGNVAALEPLAANLVAELHAVAAADKRLAPWCNWVEAQAGKLIAAAGRWPGRPPIQDDEVWPEAVAELQRASQALSAAWRGDEAPMPPEREVLTEPEETEQQRAAREHRELLDLTGPWVRVTHRPYNAELYNRLVDGMHLVVGLPEIPSLLGVGLESTARHAARVARNADDETYRFLVQQAAELRPLSCAVALLRHLMLTAKSSERDTLQEEARTEAMRLLLAETWKVPDVWVDNKAHARRLLSMTAQFSSIAVVRDTLIAAIVHDAGLLPVMLDGMAQWSEQRDWQTWQYSGASCQINELPEWFPTEQVAAVIRRQLPQLEPADEFASERHSDDPNRLASQVLWIAAGNENEW
ncbi:hypothetical protein OG742_30595 [Streptomyces sp. NBC_00828]|uniref:hypothetical protein n=1 Tax=Streptomyces sp. NBC_00828 TaxID=2903678 RepID=UPI003867386E